MRGEKGRRVREWGEYVAYGDTMIKVGISYRIFDENGNLTSTGIIWEAENVGLGEPAEEAVERARRRAREKIKRLLERHHGEG